MRDIEIAVVYDANGKCTHLAQVKVVSKQELNKLTNEQNKFDQEQKTNEKKYKNELDAEIERHKARIGWLESRTLFLAKAIYDNFVDRGLIENDDAFQQAWYDYYFNDKDLTIEQYPVEFSKILEKVR